MKRTLIIIGAIIIAGGIGGFLLLGNNHKATPSVTTPQSQPKQTTASTTKKVTLQQAIQQIGMACTGPSNAPDCTYNSVQYQFTIPSSWSADQALRTKACNQGYINSDYAVATDGSTWYATTNQNSDINTLVSALAQTGIKVESATYCP